MDRIPESSLQRMVNGVNLMPGSLRDQLERALREATEYANGIAREENEKAIRRVIESGHTAVYVLTDSERQAFKRALLPVHRAMASRIGADLIDRVYEATGFDPMAQ